MNIKIRKLKEPYPYAEIAELLKTIYYGEYGEDGTLVWNEKYVKFYFAANVIKENSKDFAYGAFKGDELIGTLFGHWDLVRVEDNQTLETLNLGLMTVKSEHRRQGIAQEMLQHLIQQAEQRNIDLIIAFPEKGRHGDKLLKEHFDFDKYGKAKHFLKLMGKEGLKAVRAQYGVITTKISSLFSHVPEVDAPEGSLRLAKSGDLEKAISLVNSYSHRVPLSTLYTKKGFQNTIRQFDSLKDRFEAPWGHDWYVLERSDELYATVCCRVEKIAFKTKEDLFEELYAALFSSIAFHEDMSLDEKKQFIGYILYKIRTNLPEISCTQITTHQHETKVFKKLRFLDDRNSYLLYMMPISEKGEIIHQYPKFKEFFLEYYR